MTVALDMPASMQLVRNLLAAPQFKVEPQVLVTQDGLDFVMGEMMLASIRASIPCSPEVAPDVLSAYNALCSGDTSALRRLFASPQAAAVEAMSPVHQLADRMAA